VISIAIKELNEKIDNLETKDQNFAASLVRQFNKNGCLSVKQEPWVYTMLARAKGECQTQVPKTEDVGSMDKLMSMFAKAGLKLKHPAIVLQVKNHVVRMSVGKRGKGEGQLNVTDGQPFGMNKWYGRVSAEGVWTQGQAYPETNDVRSLLLDMSNNPVATAQAYGHLTGRCCFCNRSLTDDNSTEVGYGPVCAEHFGLPCGNKRNGQ